MPCMHFIQIVEKDTKTKQLLPILQPIVNGLRKCIVICGEREKKHFRTMTKKILNRGKKHDTRFCVSNSLTKSMDFSLFHCS